MAAVPNNITAARRAAFAAAARHHGDSVIELARHAPWHVDTESSASDLRSQLIAELFSLERTLRPSSQSATDAALDDAAFFVRRRRVDFVRRRVAALRALPSAFRKLATMSGDECSAFINDLGAAALACAMKSIRPSELPAALHRLGPDTGRQVLQRVVAGTPDWPNELRRLVRGFYLALDEHLAGTAVMKTIGLAVLGVVGDRLTDADRQAFLDASSCDLESIVKPAEQSWLPFVEPLRVLVRERLLQPAKESR